MPIPTPQTHSEEQRQAELADRTGNTCTTGQSDLTSRDELEGSVRHFDPKSWETPSSEQGERPLSKEEVDRLYEERMEDDI
ncbi:Uncharacterized protein PECH_000630 [Penicillium ucsense]|uniref:Uncharacterized protein n=1 Tax=Penicillium ucsense TaxID=2839758 RepID=A0A8J8W0C3_9EURO|nr:Uncharacterized protein PECM_000686 [Penicillium ucsense]KAF7738363.1 Uncharacterized protein PECH_000630 [Penicillium ucsense]